MLDLSPVTLLFVETRAHKITQRVVEDCLSKAAFGDVLIYTDHRDQFNLPSNVRFLYAPDFPNKKLAGEFYYAYAMQNVNTDFALMLEWDAGIYDPTKFLPEFFNYDYIGAPWRVRPGEVNDVGNGGFTLMSKRLGERLYQDRRVTPVYTDMDVCRFARMRLEQTRPGMFKWAKADLAGKFSWELLPRDPDHFGFHGAFNWPTVLTKEEMMERVRIMLQSGYLTVKLRDVYRAAPWIVGELSKEDLAIFAEKVPPSHLLKPRIPGIMSAQQRAAMQLMHAQRRGFVSPQQRLAALPPNKGQKA